MTFGSSNPDVQTYDLVRVGVATKVGANQQLELIAVPVICQPLTSQSIDLCVSRYQHLRDLDLADSPRDGAALEVDVLIGSDYYWEFTTGNIRRGDNGPVAIRTTLGWVLSSAVPTSTDRVSPVNFLITHALSVGAPTNTENLDEVLRSFWNLESLGIKSVEETVLDEFSQTIRFKDGRYQVALPWKDPHPPLPDNYELSCKRLTGLLRRLKQHQEVLCEYDAIIRNQLQQGIVEEVNEPDNPVSGTIHYLPHHAVVRTDKETTKVRIVYDASAKSTGCSLNECLHVGPKFEQRILDILLRFRTYPVALAADIEKAFLMVSISEEDRDALRFLWVDDVTSDPPKICILRFTRVVFGVSSSPFLLNATLQHHLNLYSDTHPELVEQLSKSTYVDDVICGACDTESAYQLYRESKAVLKEGGFNLRKFVTNVTQLQQRIDDEERVPDPSNSSTSVHSSDDTYTKETLGTVQAVHSGEHKILGVRWNTSTDRLCFKFEDIARLASELEPTKRHLVSIVGRFYDPMGFLSPVVIKFKMLFQALCEERQDWDQLLTGDLLQRWKTLVTELRSSPAMSMPRCLLDGVPGEVNSFSLRGFCDASKHAYAAVVYLIIETPNGRFTRFVASKTRVSPLKSQTIPRLELLSALLLARLMRSVTECLESELTLSKPIYHTDSKVALYWIVGITKTWKQFVQHRVSEIRKLLPIDCWSHCSGVENPADIPSRGLNPVQLSLSNLWTNGPTMLGEPASDDKVERMPMPAECAVEMRAKDRDATLNLLNSDGPSLGQAIRCDDYSSLQRLLNVTSNVLKFIDNLKKIRNDTATDGVSVSRAPDAELLWIKEAQRSLTVSVQFRTLEKQFLDGEGIWRCGGRLSNADVPYSVKHPILLPRDHHFTLLIVRRAHERVLHNGVKDTLNEVRSKFWIIKCRSLLKKLIHRCVVCKRFEGKPCLGPPPPPLPKFRVAEDPPFMYTGVDFAGPLFIRTGNLAADSKVWICLYTCCVVRAIHLDIVPDLTTSAFIRSLKRFSARRGLPKRIVSDNGKTFKAAARTINAIMQHEDVKQYLSGRGVEWVFNIERAPWWGGFFERMVRMTKRCLKKMIGRAKLTYDELVTAVTEVEAVINSRPLSYISSDDMDEPLTPAHLLAGRRLLSLPDCRVNEDDFEVSAEHLTKRMNFLSRIVENFWKRWEREYLLELRNAHRYGERTSDTSPLSVGDVVLVHDDNQPRGFWRLACVKSLIEGNDGHTRGAILTVISPGEKRITLKRPLQRLYPLEVKTVSCNRSENGDESNIPLETPNQEQTVNRQRRAAAINAREQCRAIALYEQENEILD